ncbi:MAG: hypothetical protein AB7N80_14490 [Bdellovibrionales bacterium]
MTSTSVLPAVASRTYSDCKKCGCERFHVVVAHTSATAAKLECEVCHAKKTLKLDSGKKKTKSKTTKTRVPSASTRWDEVKGLISEDDQKSYNMKSAFAIHNTINHPKFGVGVVTAVAGQSMEVVFQDGTRSLVHSRA